MVRDAAGFSLRQAFAHFDASGSGVLSVETLAAILRNTTGSSPFSEAEALKIAESLVQQWGGHDRLVPYETICRHVLQRTPAPERAPHSGSGAVPVTPANSAASMLTADGVAAAAI
eukprot:5440340-Prymnesium_polylepis.1